jgi:DNA-binding NarL/FixJ family response regulator
MASPNVAPAPAGPRNGQAAHDRKWRVLIVECQPIVRYGLARLIDAEPDMSHVGQAATHAAALELFDTCNPDVVIVDLALGVEDGLELVKQFVQRRGSDVPMLVFTMMDESLFAERALRAGARGYLMKDASSDVLLAAIRGVACGEIRVSKAIADAALRRVAGRTTGEAESPLSQLSDREMQVFGLLGKGMDNHQIAEQLFISVHTVHAHREHIKTKLNFEHSKDLLRYASQVVATTATTMPTAAPPAAARS